MFRLALKWSARVLLLAWFVLTLILGMWVWRENSAAITASYFGFEFQGQTLGTVMTSMLVVGFALGALPMLVTAIIREASHKRHLKKVHKEFAKLNAVKPKD